MSTAPSLAYTIFQTSVIALVVLWSCWFAWRRLLPRSYRAVQARLATRLSSSSHPALRILGHNLTPQQVANGGGCGGGGCSSCGTCASSAAPMPSGDAQPLVFHRRVKR